MWEGQEPDTEVPNDFCAPKVRSDATGALEEPAVSICLLTLFELYLEIYLNAMNLGLPNLADFSQMNSLNFTSFSPG